MPLLIKVSQATLAELRSNTELVFVKTSSKTVLTTGRPNVGLLRLVALTSVPGNVGLVRSKDINGRTLILP